MNLIKFLKEYKSYKRRSGHRALISQKDKKKNIIWFIQLKQFEKEYSDILYKRFRIMRNLDDSGIWQLIKYKIDISIESA